MSDATVLVVDDEKNVTQLARMYLTADGFRVETAANGEQALDRIQATHPDIVVLDLMMPGMDGWEVCRSLRSSGDIPVIILTARGDDVDKIVGLELGADDYLTKPFNPRELVARVKAVLRRYRAGKEPLKTISTGGLEIDVAGREVLVNGRAIDLRPKEFDLLVTLARSPGVVFDRDRLIHLVWGYDYVGETRTVDVHMSSLREKISKSRVRIQTVWSVGYKLVPEAA
ncbi:MAG: response regulator transcription factor [Chloroflexi bacterium]|nr:response regulator transcription factor [Chloroflexota bacterium]